MSEIQGSEKEFVPVGTFSDSFLSSCSVQPELQVYVYIVFVKYHSQIFTVPAISM